MNVVIVVPHHIIKKSDLIIGATSLKGDIIVVIYYVSASEIWPKRPLVWSMALYKRGTTIDTIFLIKAILLCLEGSLDKDIFYLVRDKLNMVLTTVVPPY